VNSLPNPILFVTQVPSPFDTSTITSVFANHLGSTKACGRGGDLYIMYTDGSLKNLTAAAGYGNSGLQGTNGIAVREPSMHWSGTKALFSMVVGSPASQSDPTQFYWQIYEVSGLGSAQTPVIVHVANQPANQNNINPVYGTDDRIIFSSDRPFQNAAHLYPQFDEYRGELTNTGLYSLDPGSGDLLLLDHSPSGDFRPFIDSYGRVIFSRWDHLQRDSRADVDIIDGNTSGSFNYSDESAGASVLQNNRTEYYPEPQSKRTDLLAGTNMIGFEFNHFIPWQINEDGTEGETMNHVGRHDLNIAFGRNFNDDPNLVNFSPSPTRRNKTSINNMFQLAEDPTSPGKYYAIDCQENGTHGAGQIIALFGAPSLDAQDMYDTSITDRSTAFYLPEGGTPNATYTGHYRNPLPLSNGSLLCVHTPENHVDKNLGTYLNPAPRYDFRIKTLKIRTGSIWTADSIVTPGITKTVSYWSDSGLVNFSGTMWELDPVEVKSRAIPPKRSAHMASPEQQVFSEEGVDTTQFQDYLKQHNLALIVSRNMTNRNTDDRQQPFYLKVHNSTQQSPNPTGKVYDIAHLQIVQAKYLRGYGLVNGNMTPVPGRRVLPYPLDDTSAHNVPDPTGPAGSVEIGIDGSMAAFVPAHRATAWQLVDSAGTPVVRERFWVTMQPGEIRVCASCHGSNGEAAVPKQIIPQNEPEALRTLLQYWKTNLVPSGIDQYAMNASWNLVSVPRILGDSRTTAIYPTASSGAFGYKGSYVKKDTLVNGIGYWIKFATSQYVTITGSSFTSDTVDVTPGWNLIGALSSPIDPASITSMPPGITTTNFYAYSGSSYQIADSLRPGKGFWVKVNSAGKLVLSSSGPTMPAGNIHITQTTELPPSPPGVDAASGQPLPQTFELGQNYPNPFNPSTVIRYNLPAARVGPTFLSVYHVSLRVYNLLGQVVATLIDDVEESGYKSVSWDAATLPSGVYFYRLEANAVDNPANSFSEIRKMLTIK
jgi:hypothetical protein